MKFELKRCDECGRYFIDLFICPCCGSGFITKLEMNKNDENYSKYLIEYVKTSRIIDKIQDIKIFIGSTRGSLNKVKYFAKCLPYTDPKFEEMKLLLWDKDVFDIGETSIESLIRTSKMVDMAVFFFTGEDILITENNYFHTIRDNLLFEYGLFMGTVGIKNVYILMEKNNNIKLPSDLYGVNYLTYNDITKMDHILNAITKKAKDIFVEKVNTYLSNNFGSQDRELEEAYHRHMKKMHMVKQKNDAKTKQINKKVSEIKLNVERGVYHAGIFIDVDKMNQINDKYGKDHGDKILKVITKIIADSLKQFNYYFCRLYGDSFFVLLNSSSTEILNIAKQILNNISKFHWSEFIGGLYVSCSAGIAAINSTIENKGNIKLIDQETVEDFILKAIQGCITAKQKGGNKVISVNKLSFWMQTTTIGDAVS